MKKETIDNNIVFTRYRRLLAKDYNTLLFAEFAEQLRQAGQLEEAEQVCRVGLSRHQGYATGHFLLGDILRDAGRLNEAESEWSEGKRLDPQHPRTQNSQIMPSTAKYEHFPLQTNQHGRAEMREGWKGERGEGRRPENGERRRAGEKPKWLSEAKYGVLLGKLMDYEAVSGAAILDAEGAVVVSVGMSVGVPVGVSFGDPVVTLLSDIKNVLSRLGAGRLRSLFVEGEGVGTKYLPLDELTLICRLTRGATPGESNRQVEAALLVEDEEAEENGFKSPLEAIINKKNMEEEGGNGQ